MNRRPSAEQAPQDYTPQGAPGIFVPGPDGEPVFTPIYYSPPNTAPRARSRSTSKHSRRESTPPEPSYQAYHPRFYPPPAGMRPPSSSSHTSIPDEPDWYQPTAPRTRSASNAQQYSPSYRDDYGPGPAAPGAATAGARRNVSGPPDVLYGSTLRRVAPGSSPLAPRGHSDPQMTAGSSGRKGSGLSQEVRGQAGSSSSSSSDDQGVQVEMVPEQHGGNGGYGISRVPVGAGGDGGAGRRRKTGRR
ncbi:hypothetical protein MBLNU230_g6145t1 [Neophaeotheca triangularis]